MNAWHVRLTEFCIARARLVVTLTLAIVLGFGWITVETFAINTDTARLISAKTPWRQAEIAFDTAFPSRTDLIVVVLDGKTSEAVDLAAEKLTRTLAATGTFRSVRRPDAGLFFDKNGLLLLSDAEFRSTLSGIVGQQPFLSVFAADPGLGGVLDAVQLGMMGLSGGHTELPMLTGAFDAISTTIEAALKGPVKPLSWRMLLSEQAPSRLDLRRLILIQPRLDFTALQPGAAAIDLVRKTGRDLGLTPENDISLRLTGPVPLADEEFATVAEGAAINTAGTLLVVILLLFAALRSWRLVSAVIITLLAGLVITAGFGLVMVREYNLISVAFAVLFVGLGVDFSIQLAVRYRDMRLARPALFPAIREATLGMARPLLLASTSTAIGFLAFLPTSFKGVSELGLIAGSGMMIAFAASMILLPALLAILSPPVETQPIRYVWLSGADHFIERHRRVILAVTGIVFLAGLPLLGALRFDSDPMNLRDARVESVATFLDLGRDSETSPMTLDVITPSVEAAKALARRISALPEVARVASIATFVPDAQEARLEAIKDAAILIDTVLDPINRKAARGQSAMLVEIAQTRKALAMGLSATDASADPSGAASLRRLDQALALLAAASPDLY
ncbi:MAG: MMPL family transporter, partial [Beijerinckiaceae bacterium]